MNDSKGNLINVTVFESYLSKYLIENPGYFEPVLQKILTAFEDTERLNNHDRHFDRVMFMVNSLVMTEFSEYKSIQHLKENIDLFSAHYLIKLFCDHMLAQGLIQIFPKPEPKPGIPSLALLCQQSLFGKTPAADNPLIPFLKPSELFHEANRGVRLLKNAKPVLTKKLGITTLETTPPGLVSYFPEEHEPSQFEYIPNRRSHVGKWLSQLHLPIISGTSGSARDLLGLLLKLVRLESSDIRLLLISLAATLVAKGHHSYFEIMMMDRFGYKLQAAPDLYSFYEQTLPKSISSSKSFIAFKTSAVGASLIEHIPLRLEADDKLKHVPTATVIS